MYFRMIFSIINSLLLQVSNYKILYDHMFGNNAEQTINIEKYTSLDFFEITLNSGRFLEHLIFH